MIDYRSRKWTSLPPSKRFIALVLRSIFHTATVTDWQSFRALAWTFEDYPNLGALVRSIDWTPTDQILHYHLDLARFLASVPNVIHLNLHKHAVVSIESFCIALRRRQVIITEFLRQYQQYAPSRHAGMAQECKRTPVCGARTCYGIAIAPRSSPTHSTASLPRQVGPGRI